MSAYTCIDTKKTRGVFRVEAGGRVVVITATANQDGWVTLVFGDSPSGEGQQVVLGLAGRDGVVLRNGDIEKGQRMAFSNAKGERPFLITDKVSSIKPIK